MALAAFLWLIHSLNTVYNYTLKVPVSFKNLPAGKRPLSNLPEELTLNVKASGLKLLFILINKPFSPVDVDFNSLAAVNKDQNYVLSASGLNFKNSLGWSAQIKQIRPDTLYFSERTGVQKTVAVKVPLQIRCREGYGHRPVVIEPAVATIWGDTLLIRDVDTLYTQPLTLSDVYQDLSVATPIIKPGRDVYSFVSEVKVSVKAEKLLEHSVRVTLSDLARRGGRRSAIFPSTVKIRFTCIRGAFQPSDTTQFRAVINSEKVNPVTKKTPVFLTVIPPYATVMEVTPEEAEFLILKE